MGYNNKYMYLGFLLITHSKYVNGQTTIERIENEYWVIPSCSLLYQKEQSTLLIHYLPKSCSLLPFKISPMKKRFPCSLSNWWKTHCYLQRDTDESHCMQWKSTRCRHMELLQKPKKPKLSHKHDLKHVISLTKTSTSKWRNQKMSCWPLHERVWNCHYCYLYKY